MEVVGEIGPKKNLKFQITNFMIIQIQSQLGNWKNSEMFETAPRRQIEIS